MTTTPTLSWWSIAVPSKYAWSEGVEGGTPPALPALVHGSDELHFAAVMSGSASVAVTGDVTAGSFDITNVSATADLEPGMAISGPGIPRWSRIWSIAGSTVTFVNGTIEPSSGAWVPTANDRPATASSTGAAITVSDPEPLGTLAVTVSGPGGDAIYDQNFDGTTSDSYVGSGTAICNLIGGAEGGGWITFSIPGTFTVALDYVPNDPNYSATSSPDPLTVVVE